MLNEQNKPNYSDNLLTNNCATITFRDLLMIGYCAYGLIWFADIIDDRLYRLRTLYFPYDVFLFL